MIPLIDKLDSIESSVNDYPGAIHGANNSPVRFNIPRESLKLESKKLTLPGFPRSAPHMAGSIYNIFRSIKDLENNPQTGKNAIDKNGINELISYTKSVGADAIGFTQVPREWVFRDMAICFNKAIVLVMEMDKKNIDLAPHYKTGVTVHETYNKLGQVSNKVANWLRKNGYAAHAGHPLGGMAYYPPIAQAAGLGWIGQNGLLITPQFGPRVRLAAVFTDIENLPFNKDNAYEWIEEFCETCGKCRRECPTKAFYESPIRHDNGLKTFLNIKKCFPFFANNHGCSVCIKICPFNQQGYEKIRSGFIRKQR